MGVREPRAPRRASVLVASDDDGRGTGASRIAIRRGLVFQGDSQVDDIDLAVEGEALLEIDAAIANTQPDETFQYTTTELTIDGVYAGISESRDARARLAPSLQPGDDQHLYVHAFTHVSDELSTSRSVATSTPDFRGVEFLPRMEGVVHLGSDGKSVSWDELLTVDYSEVSLFSTNAYQLRLTTTKRWIEKHQLTGMVVDTSPPGFDLAWLDGLQSLVSFSLGSYIAEPYKSTNVSRFSTTNPSLRALDREHAKREVRRRTRRRAR